MDRFYYDYYMNYPYYDIFSRRNDESRDMIYMRKMYPETMMEIQQIVDDECDMMEYDGSLMFDEYPDRIMLDRFRVKVCDRVHGECKCVEKCKDKDMVNDAVSVMLCNEMCRRRCRRRNCRY